MDRPINLADKMARQLPTELVNFIKSAGRLAHSQGESLYLVGGSVRDLLLGKANFDLDLMAEGDAATLAYQLMPDELFKITVHQRFGTVKLKWQQYDIDLATARRESYSRPGALPGVRPGSLSDDLLRRDFTINAMAVSLNPDKYGELIDLYGGLKDLKRKFIRLLHEKSFIDDATRIWRGLRYEQRLDFQLEAETLKLLKRDIAMLGTISGERLRYELECILGEERPEKVLRRAHELGVLKSLHPSLKGNGWLKEKFEAARKLYSPDQPPPGLYLALLTHHLTEEEKDQFTSKLRLTKLLTKTLLDAGSLKRKLESLADAKLKPSRIYGFLHGYSTPTIKANLLASDSAVVQKHLKLFLDKLRYVKPALNGDDLKKIGIAPGPRFKEILNRLQEARLDGEVSSRQDEEKLVREWLGKNTGKS